MERSLRRCQPQEWIESVSPLLYEAWDPARSDAASATTLDYSPEYLRWQFSQPSSLPPVCFVVEEAGRLACFVAAIGHRVQYDGQESEIYISSHFAAARGGHGMNALSILRAEGEAIAASGHPVLSFAIPESAGEKLMRFFALKGYCKMPGGLLPGYLAMAKPGANVAQKVDCETWASACAELPQPPSTISVSLHRESLAYYETHPWTREFIVAFEGDRPVAAATAGTIRSITRQGQQITGVLNSIRVNSTAGLDALIRYVGSRFNTPAVSLPVCGHICPEILKGVRARRIGGEFRWHLYGPGDVSVAGAAHATVEIV